jgi:Tol biopolymer transport system component
MHALLTLLPVVALSAGACDTPSTRLAWNAPARDTVPQPTTRRVWDQARDYATPSPDGTLFAFVDWGTGDVAVYDPATGRDRRITDKGTWRENGSWAEHPRFSPDGTRVVYSYGNVRAGDPHLYELRAVRLGDTTQHLLMAMASPAEWIMPLDWHSTAGILVEVTRADGSAELGSVSPETGSYRLLRRFTEGNAHPHEAAASADGRWVAYSGSGELRLIGTDGARDRTLGVSQAKLLGWTRGDGGILFHADRDGTRGIWLLRISNGRREGEPVLVRGSIPALAGAGAAGGRFYYSVPVDGPRVHVTAVDVENARLLVQPQAVTVAEAGFGQAPSWSPDGRSFAYLLRAHGEPHRIMIRSADGENEREIAVMLPGNAFALAWAPDGSAVYVTANGSQGPALFRYDVATGNRAHVHEPVGRHVAIAPDGGAAILSRPDGVYVWDFALRSERRLVERRGATDVAISPDGGTVAYVQRIPGGGDRILTVPFSGGEPAEILRVASDLHIEPTGYTLAWTPDGRHLLALVGDESRRHRVVAVPANGGEARVLLELPLGIDGPEPAHASLHPDGRRLLYAAGQARNELWVLEGLSGPP